jgi:four helix bundle protein
MKKASIDNLEIYNEAFILSNEVWLIVSKWNIFNKDTIGKQVVRSADSVVLNIAEGFGRFNFRENRQFCFYARGSLQETLTTLKLAGMRNVMDPQVSENLQQRYTILAKRLNNYIKAINRKITGLCDMPGGVGLLKN